jgi:hypothetical protein
MRFVGQKHPCESKSVVVVGGIMALQPQYRRVLEEHDLDPRIFNRDTAGIWGRLKGADAIILFSGTISHKMAIKARKTALSFGIPLITVRRSSVSALKRSISGLPLFSLSVVNDEVRH